MFGAAASFVGWLSLIAIFTVPYVFGTSIGQEIGMSNGVLYSYWLYIHVTMVTASYALIGMGFLLSVWWLVRYYADYRTLARISPRQLEGEARGFDVVYTGSGGSGSAGAVPAMGLASTLARLAFFPGRQGAGRPAGGPRRETAVHPTASFLAALDACNLVVLQLAFWVLGAGDRVRCRLGRHELGPAVGVGPEGDVRADHLDRLPDRGPRPRDDRAQGVVDGRPQHGRVLRHAVQLDRRELLPARAAQLRGLNRPAARRPGLGRHGPALSDDVWPSTCPNSASLVALDPADPLSRFALGRKLAETDEALSEAVEHLRFANAHAPDHLATYHILSDALIRLGRPDEARPVLRAGLQRADAVGEGMGRDLGPAMRGMLDGIG